MLRAACGSREAAGGRSWQGWTVRRSDSRFPAWRSAVAGAVAVFRWRGPVFSSPVVVCRSRPAGAAIGAVSPRRRRLAPPTTDMESPRRRMVGGCVWGKGSFAVFDESFASGCVRERSFVSAGPGSGEFMVDGDILVSLLRAASGGGGRWGGFAMVEAACGCYGRHAVPGAAGNGRSWSGCTVRRSSSRFPAGRRTAACGSFSSGDVRRFLADRLRPDMSANDAGMGGP